MNKPYMNEDPARTWSNAWGQDAIDWCKKFFRKGSYADKQSFVRACMTATKGKMNPQVAFDVWDENQVKEAA